LPAPVSPWFDPENSGPGRDVSVVVYFCGHIAKLSQVLRQLNKEHSNERQNSSFDARFCLRSAGLREERVTQRP
jgi:hypothetical protein